MKKNIIKKAITDLGIPIPADTAKKLILISIFPAWILTIILSLTPGNNPNGGSMYSASPVLTPWASIGGCGAGGGDAGGAGLVEWVGQGISGGYFDMEVNSQISVRPLENMGGILSSRTLSMPLMLNYHPGFLDVQVTMPLQYKTINATQFTFDRTSQVGGMGDVALSLSKMLGASGQFNFNAGLVFPTGPSDVHNLNNELVPHQGQLGGGVIGGNAGLKWIMDKDWGLFLFSTTYSGGLLYNKTQDIEYDSELKRAVPTKKSWSSARKKLSSINKLGVIQPDYVSVKSAVGAKMERLYHSFGISFSFPLSKGHYDKFEHPSEGTLTDYSTKEAAWDNAYNKTQINGTDTVYTYRDTDSTRFKIAGLDEFDNWVIQKRTKQSIDLWPGMTLSYGMEVFREDLPLFWAISLPFEFDEDNGFGLKGFSAQVGIKFVVY